MTETAPYTWTLDQIRQVRSLYANARVDIEALERDAEAVMNATRHKLAKMLQHEARPFAVELHAGDLEFDECREDSAPFTITIRSRWNPTTNEIVLSGGRNDGQAMAIQKVGDPIRIPVLNALDAFMSEDTHPATEISMNHDTYELAGWAEHDRRWVYELA
jgi:hypothetical protein